MIKIQVNPNELRAAGQVAQNAEIISVRLAKVSLENNISPIVEDGKQFDVGFDWGTEPHLVPVPGLLVARVWLRVDLAASNPAEAEADTSGDDPKSHSEVLAHMELRFDLHYAIPKDPVPEDIEKAGGLEAFARWNALYNCWPYFRQEADRLGRSAGLPPIQLPLMMLSPAPSGSEKKAEDDKAGQQKK